MEWMDWEWEVGDAALIDTGLSLSLSPLLSRGGRRITGDDEEDKADVDIRVTRDVERVHIVWNRGYLC